MTAATTIRKHAVTATIGGALLLTGLGFGAAAATGNSPDTREVSDSSTPAATTTTTSAPTSAPAVAPQVVPEVAGDTPAVTIAPVIPAEPTAADVPVQAPAPAPAPNQGVGTTGTDGRYTPAPVQPKAGEPPVADSGAIMPPAEPLPGETLGEPATP